MARKSSSKAATEEAVETAAAEAAEVETAAVETAAAETPEAEAETATAEATEPEPRMYVGPTISGLGIQNRVYVGLPESAAEKIAEHPFLRNLFIPIAKYPLAEKQLREEKGYIYNAFNKALELK